MGDLQPSRTEPTRTERSDLESAAADVTYLRGLFGIPIGLLFVLTGLGNLGWGPFSEAWAFLVVLALISAVGLGVYAYYDHTYGRVIHSTKHTVISGLVYFGAMVGGSFLDFKLDLPISVFAVSFALAMLGWFAFTVGLHPRHLVIWGALLVAGLLPVWGGLADSVSVAWLPIGVAAIVAGIFDHLALVRTYGPAKNVDSGRTDVRTH